MFGGQGDEDTTKLQDCILETYDSMVHPSGINEIAAHCDCSESYVRETLNEYRSGGSNDDGNIFL